MRFRSTNSSGSSYLPRRYHRLIAGHHCSRASSYTRDRASSRRIHSKSTGTFHSKDRSDTDDSSKSFSSSSSSTDYYSDTSTYSESGTEYDSSTSIDESSYNLSSTECDSYTSSYESSYSLCDSEFDCYSYTDESSDSLSSTNSSEYTFTCNRQGKEITGMGRNTPKTQMKVCRSDHHSSTKECSSSNTSKNSGSETYDKSWSERDSSYPRTDTSSTSSFYDGDFDKRASGFNALPSSMCYGQNHGKRGRGLKRYSSGRKKRSSTEDQPPLPLPPLPLHRCPYCTTVSKQYYNRTSQDARAGVNKKRHCCF